MLDRKKAEEILEFEIAKKLGARGMSFRVLFAGEDRYDFEVRIKLGKEEFLCAAYVENLGEWDYDFEVTIPSFKIRPDGIRRASMNKTMIASELVKIAEDLVGREMDVFDYHQKKIAISTLKMSDAGVNIMGGMNKDEARNFLRKIGYSEQQIARIENS